MGVCLPVVISTFRRHLLCHLFRSGNRLNHHHLAHHAALHRRSLTRELVQFSLVSIERVNFLPDDQRVLRSLFHACSSTLSRAFVFGHVVSAAHGIAHGSS